MNTHTRLFFGGAGPAAPRPSQRSGTVAFGAPPPAGPRFAFEQQFRLIRSAHLEERRPGAFLFVVDADGRQLGRMWLAATEQPRVASLGRHDAAHLSIAVDEAVSLRHLLFVVRRRAGRVRATVVDLESASGLHTLRGQQQVLEVERPALLRTARLSFVCVPTGPGTSLPSSAEAAWALLAEPPPRRSLFDELLRRPALRVGSLMVRGQPFSLDAAMLERGALIGRDARCDVIVPDPCASRVHAVVLAIDGVPHLVDAGSSNGTWSAEGERIHSVPLGAPRSFHVGRWLVGWLPAP
ncbi:MAG: FHA domain-containing protein [Myxococcota bacterium]